MRRLIVLFILMAILPVSVSADPFSPTRLKLTAETLIMYDFDGGPLEIPVTVTGTNAGVVFCMFTKSKAPEIGSVTNGYLGWHYVNKIDTCIYYSSMYEFDPGENLVTWNGRDQDGNIPPIGDYTYYMWAFDNINIKTRMCKHTYTGKFMEYDPQGYPLDNPIYYSGNWRWYVGDDPMDEALVETTSYTAAAGWSHGEYNIQIDPHDFQYFYAWAGNDETGKGSIVKYRWIADGDAEIQTDFGNDGYAELYGRGTGGTIGVETDGDFLFTADENNTTSVEPDVQFYIYDYSGSLVEEVDLTAWWSDEASFTAGAQMNGGPNNAFVRHGKVFLNCHCSCLNQMVDPKRYLDTMSQEDFTVWSNGNGDYTGDHNFEETAQLKWICMDYTVGPYKYTIAADDNLFSVFNAYDGGAVSFGLFAPDGTGLGYYQYAGETAGKKYSTKIIDSDSSFDGIYCCNKQSMRIGYSGNLIDSLESVGTWFIGHDSISGIIYSNIECWGYLMLLNDFTDTPLNAGASYTITWHSTLWNSLVYLELSSDNGETWSLIAQDVDADQKEYVWTVPDIESDQCLLRISKSKPNVCLYSDVSDVFTITNDPVFIEDFPPLEFAVTQPAPNPFNPTTTIRFTLPERMNATVAVYNIAGQRVVVLHNGVLDPGSHTLVWDAAGFAAGVYFCTVEAGKYRETVKMTLAK